MTKDMKQLNFHALSEEKGHYEYLKSWPNWSGEIPQKGDIVVLHFGDNNEIELCYIVDCRVIDGTKADTVRINVTRI